MKYRNLLIVIQNLKTNKNLARRIFGKKEIEIIMKQLDGMLLTQSEKNRLSRDIKPKFEAIKELSKFQDEFEIKKNQDNKKIIERAVNIILNDKLKDNIQAILLFGSFADKTFHKNSDIDVCVVFKKKLPLKEATQFRIRIAGELPEKVDIQVFNILPQKIKKEIARYNKKQKFISYLPINPPEAIIFNASLTGILASIISDFST